MKPEIHHTVQTHQSTKSDATPAEQVNIRIATAIKTGEKHVTVKLSPAELGQVEVRIDTNIHGKATVSIIIHTYLHMPGINLNV